MMKKAILLRSGLSVLTIILLGWLLLMAALNHVKDWPILSQNVESPWIMQRYHADVPLTPEQGYRAGDVVFSEIDRQLFADDQPIMILQRPLLGAIVLEHIYLLATDDSLIVLNKSPVEALEILAAGSGIPAQIQNIGLHYNEPVLQTRSGMWRGDFLLHQWELLMVEGVAWSQPEPLPIETTLALQNYLTGDITWQTFLNDLRSGDFFGGNGRWIITLILILNAVFILRAVFGFSVKPDSERTGTMQRNEQSS